MLLNFTLLTDFHRPKINLTNMKGVNLSCFEVLQDNDSFIPSFKYDDSPLFQVTRISHLLRSKSLMYANPVIRFLGYVGADSIILHKLRYYSMYISRHSVFQSLVFEPQLYKAWLSRSYFFIEILANSRQRHFFAIFWFCSVQLGFSRLQIKLK